MTSDEFPKADAQAQFFRLNKRSRGEAAVVVDAKSFRGKSQTAPQTRLQPFEVDVLTEKPVELLLQLNAMVARDAIENPKNSKNARSQDQSASQ